MKLAFRMKLVNILLCICIRCDRPPLLGHRDRRIIGADRSIGSARCLGAVELGGAGDGRERSKVVWRGDRSSTNAWRWVNFVGSAVVVKRIRGK